MEFEELKQRAAEISCVVCVGETLQEYGPTLKEVFYNTCRTDEIGRAHV